MCGIVGGTSRDWPYERAVQVLGHRGPDAQQTLHIGRMVLGFSRLSIIDLRELANQPMASEDEMVWLVFNGEIYSFFVVRAKLEQLGRRFRTQSDTEVVLQAYLQWGDAFVDHLDGMFAMGIYDRRVEKLKLLRDRPGVKPLYYYWNGREFAFASELKGIEILCGDGRLSVDPTAVYDFLTYRYIPTPKTFYRHVYKLPPASRLVYDVTRNLIEKETRYWNLEVDPQTSVTLTNEDACDELRSLMEKSVKEQLVADVPVGCFLSGGIDSSVVVATSAERHHDLKTFSIGFDVAEHTETHFAKQVAQRFQTNHREKTFSLSALGELFPQLKKWYDEPFADTSAFPTYYVSQLARETVAVALTGDGGDELFGGYRWYQRYRKIQRWGIGRVGGWGDPWDRLRQRLVVGSFFRKLISVTALLGADALTCYTKILGGLTKGEKQGYAKLLEIDSDYDDYWFFRRHWRHDLPLLTRLQYLDFHTYLPDDILTKVDRVSMANSLECRVPFLSQGLIEFAFSLPESVRYHNGQLKGLLKQAYRKVLPAAILERGKKGFSMPPQYHHSGREQQWTETILDQLYDIRLV